MANLTQAQWNALWAKTTDDQVEVRAWLHEQMVEENFDILHGVVVKLA